MLPPLLPCCSLDYPGWQLLNQPFLFYIFSLSTRVSPVSRTASTTILRFLALFHLPSALPNPVLVPVIVVPVPISATILASVPVPVPVPIRCSSMGTHPRSRPRSHPVPAPVPVPVLRSFVHFHPRSRSRSVPVPMTVHLPVSVSAPAPDSNPAPAPVRSFLPLGSCYPPGTMRLYRRRALRMGPSDARKRHPQSAEMVTRAE